MKYSTEHQPVRVGGLQSPKGVGPTGCVGAPYRADPEQTGTAQSAP